MGRLITCIRAGVYPDALARGRKYELLATSEDGRTVRVRGDNGRTRWYSTTCFDLASGPAPVLVSWQFDERVENALDDLIHLSFVLDDGTRRWCTAVTPACLTRLLEQPYAEPGMHLPHTIVVRSLAAEVVEQALRALDQQGELIAASLPLIHDEDAGTSRSSCSEVEPAPGEGMGDQCGNTARS